MDPSPYSDSVIPQHYSDNEHVEDTSSLLGTVSDFPHESRVGKEAHEPWFGATLDDDCQPSQSTTSYHSGSFFRKPDLTEDQIFQLDVVNSTEHTRQVESDLEESRNIGIVRPKRNRRRVYDPQEQVLYPPDERIRESVRTGARFGVRIGARSLLVTGVIVLWLLFILVFMGFIAPWLIKMIIRLQGRRRWDMSL